MTDKLNSEATLIICIILLIFIVSFVVYFAEEISYIISFFAL
jgi:uncharacterized membrane protein